MAKRKRRKHHNRPRRARRARRSRRSYHRNPLNLGGVGSFMTPILWGGAGYLASKFAGNLVRRYIPNMIPMPDLAAAAVGGAAASYAGGMIAPGQAQKEALRVGAMIPVVEAAVNMTSLGHMLGTQKVVMLAPPSGAPASAGVQAALAAALSADLRDEYETDY